MKILKLIILLLLVSCYNKEELFSMENIQEFSSPPKKGSIDNETVEISITDIKEYVFIKVDDKQRIAKVSINDLDFIYQEYYKNEDYTLFLYEVLNFKKAIPIQYFSNQNRIHTLDSKILDIYNKKGIEGIKSLYTTEEKKGKFFINPTMEYNHIVTIQYLFYINKYEYYNDDYIPLMWFEKNKEFSLYKNIL